MAPQAAARRRAPRRRPLPGLQRAPHLAPGPDGDAPSSTGSGSTTWPRAGRPTAAASSTTAAGRRPRASATPTTRSSCSRAWRRARWSCGARRASSSTTRCCRPSCRSRSATPPSSSPTVWTAAIFTFTQRVEATVALHYHRATEPRQREGRAARRLLEAVPGIKVVEFEPDPRWGRTCTPALQEQLGPDGLAADGARRHRPGARRRGPRTWPASTTAAIAISAASSASARSWSSTT